MRSVLATFSQKVEINRRFDNLCSGRFYIRNIICKFVFIQLVSLNCLSKFFFCELVN